MGQGEGIREKMYKKFPWGSNNEKSLSVRQVNMVEDISERGEEVCGG